MQKKKCKLCSNEFFGGHPYCSKCYNILRKNQNYYNTIQKDWKLEAKQEDTKYFYFVNEAEEIISGQKNIVIGRKGEGKTAIAQYIYNQNNYNIYTEKMTFKNFPFNIIYKLSDSNFTKPNQYISIWKYLIYTTICKKMIANENISSNIRNQLLKVFPTENKESKLSKLIEKYTVKDFGFQILSSGINASVDKKKEEISWIEIVDILEYTILEHIDDAKYYVIFDELDEDYKNFRDEQERINYFDMITGLFKAVQDIRTLFDGKKINIFPFIFLRTDIYNLITYSDKNKWSDSIINIVWTPNKLKELIKYRFNVLFETEETESLSFNECWIRMFGTREVGYGSRKMKKMSSFDYILRSTQNRPRDFIKYFQECAKQALNRNSFLVDPKIVREVDNEFSEYMKNEIIDEIYAVLPEYEEIFSILSLIRKQTFNPSEFVERYDQKVKDGVIVDRGAEKVLKLLFDYSVIGNDPSIKHQIIFKYEKESAKFNFKENIIVHRGLYKALQIF
jgi:hypothetical protein